MIITRRKRHNDAAENLAARVPHDIGAKKRRMDDDLNAISSLLTEKYPYHSGGFLRCEVISYLPADDLMAALATCQAMRNSVHDMMKGSPVPLPSESHLLTQGVSLLEWGSINGYQLQPDREDDDRDIDLRKPDTWVRRIGSFTRASLAGNLETLRYLIEVKNCPRNMEYAIMFAAYGGHLDCLEWLCEMSDMKNLASKCLLAASYGGHIEVLNWLRVRFSGVSDRRFTLDEIYTIGHEAALGGHRSVIQWLRDSGYTFSECCSCGAAEGGHLELLQWLIESKCSVPAWPSNFERSAGRGGSKAILAWVRDAGYAWNQNTSCGAAAGGHTETLQWLIENGCPTPAYTHLTNFATREGHIPMIEWLLDHGYTVDEGTCEDAAEYGQLPALKFLCSRGCPWNDRTTKAAADCGRINTLRWAIANGCPVTDVATRVAASGGHLEVLKMLVENGCPVPADCTLEAARGGHLEVLIMLVEDFRCDIDVSLCIHVLESIDSSSIDSNKRIQVLNWLEAWDSR